MILATVALAGVMVSGPIALAQDNNNNNNTPPAAGNGDNSAPRPRGGAGRMQAMLDKLNLTDDQKPKVKAVMDDQREKMMALRDDSSLSQEDRRAKFKAISDATDAKLKEILTADQYTKWEEMRKQMMQRRRNGGGGNGNGNGNGNAPASSDNK